VGFAGTSLSVGKQGTVAALEHLVDELACNLKSLFLGCVLAENARKLETLGVFALTDRNDLVREQPVAPNTVHPMKLLAVMHHANS
jgi:hypothetical protein